MTRNVGGGRRIGSERRVGVPLTTAAPEPVSDVEALRAREAVLAVLNDSGAYESMDAIADAVMERTVEPLDVERLAREAFDKTMEHVEPWASGPVSAKHGALFVRNFAAALHPADPSRREPVK